ncbi:hypothetical protein HORM4_670021 [Vibrio harveyi]|nr:hypothetical protein HORM4_670021 [Vibrio harveyi]
MNYHCKKDLVYRLYNTNSGQHDKHLFAYRHTKTSQNNTTIIHILIQLRS